MNDDYQADRKRTTRNNMTIFDLNDIYFYIYAYIHIRSYFQRIKLSFFLPTTIRADFTAEIINNFDNL